MPEQTMILAALKIAAQALLKIVPLVWKTLPSNGSIQKAIRLTAERFSSRLPSLQAALETWVTCDAFRSKVEAMESGALTDTEVAHVELFVQTTGYGLGLSSFETLSEGLSYFYSEIYDQLLGGEHSGRLIGAKLDTQRRELRELLRHWTCPPF